MILIIIDEMDGITLPPPVTETEADPETTGGTGTVNPNNRLQSEE